MENIFYWGTDYSTAVESFFSPVVVNNQGTIYVLYREVDRGMVE